MPAATTSRSTSTRSAAPPVERAARRTPREIVLAGDAFVKGGGRQVNPELARHFMGPQGQSKAWLFLAECESDPELRAACEDQGFDLEGWRQQLEEADTEVRLANSAKESK